MSVIEYLYWAILNSKDPIKEWRMTHNCAVSTGEEDPWVRTKVVRTCTYVSQYHPPSDENHWSSSTKNTTYQVMWHAIHLVCCKCGMMKCFVCCKPLKKNRKKSKNKKIKYIHWKEKEMLSPTSTAVVQLDRIYLHVLARGLESGILD
jgi:hypothetical protein